MTPRILPPARAILWEYLARYPWLDAAIVGGLALMTVLGYALPESWRVMGDEGMPFVIFLVILFFFGIIALFSVNTSRPRSAPGGFPARFFLYPMSPARLVAWPMLFGATAMALGWVAVAALVLPRFGFRLSLPLGALAASASLAWLQALAWWPFGTSLALVLVVSIVPTLLIGLVLWPIFLWGWGPGVAWALLPIYLVAAYAVAVRGVSLDRRGDGRGGRRWLTAFEWIERLVEFIPGARSRFASAARAQSWLEWRSKGSVLFIIVAALTLVTIFFVTVLPHIQEGDKPIRVFLGVMFLQPMMICAIMGAAFAKDEMGGRTPGMSPFSATRPLTSEALAAAKLRAAAFTLLVSCAFAAVTVSLWAVASGNFGAIASQVAALARGRDAITVGLVAATGPVVLFALTWKGMVGAMVPVLTGRNWVSYAIALAFILAAALIGGATILFAPIVGARIADLKLILAGKALPPRFLLVAMPLAIGLILGLKLALSAFAFRAAIRRGLIGRRGVVEAALLWAIPTACLLALGALLLRPSNARGWLALAMLAALLPPLGRFPAATLALDWDRHR